MLSVTWDAAGFQSAYGAEHALSVHANVLRFGGCQRAYRINVVALDLTAIG